MSSATTSTRKSTTRSRQGCNTCKRRRIRCDEVKPRCTPCYRSSRVCEFSATPIRPAAERLKVVLWQSNRPGARHISPDPARSATEARAFAYFYSNIATNLDSYFDLDFWSRLVPQSAQHEAFISHAVVALASLSECQSKNEALLMGGSRSCDQNTLQQYNKAITTLSSKLKHEEPPIETILTACVLFVYFEMLQNHHESALRQMASGAYLYYDYYTKQSGVPISATLSQHNNRSELHDCLTMTFARMVFQLLMFPDISRMDWRLVNPCFTLPIPDVPPEFHSIRQARDDLDVILTSTFHGGLLHHFDNLNGGKNKLEAQYTGPALGLRVLPLHQWSQAFQLYVTNPATNLSAREQRSAKMLKVQQVTGLILASAGAGCNEMAFDPFEHDFAKIIALASQVLEKSPESLEVHSPSSPGFDMGVLPPLYLTASRCRHPEYRREALRLMDLAPRQEGIWHNRMLSRIAERIMTVEETGIVAPKQSSDIPSHVRVSLRNTRIDSTRQIVTVCMFRREPLTAVSVSSCADKNGLK